MKPNPKKKPSQRARIIDCAGCGGRATYSHTAPAGRVYYCKYFHASILEPNETKARKEKTWNPSVFLSPKKLLWLQLRAGVILFTRDGRKQGNAIITQKNPARDVVGATLPATFSVETDYGTTAKLTSAEIEALFRIGPRDSVRRWRLDRETLRAENRIEQTLPKTRRTV